MIDDQETEPNLQKAIALYYDGRNTPTISAKGVGELAEDIIDIAQQNDVPLCDNPALIDLLMTLELGDEIPETLYIAIAHIISFAWKLQGKEPEGFELGGVNP
jgi:flagellar biosynthesis protein